MFAPEITPEFTEVTQEGSALEKGSPSYFSFFFLLLQLDRLLLHLLLLLHMLLQLLHVLLLLLRLLYHRPLMPHSLFLFISHHHSN